MSVAQRSARQWSLVRVLAILIFLTLLWSLPLVVARQTVAAALGAEGLPAGGKNYQPAVAPTATAGPRPTATPTPFSNITGEVLVIKADKLVIQSAAGPVTVSLSSTAHLIVGQHLRQVSALNEGDRVRCVTWDIAGELVAGPIFLQASSTTPSQPSLPMDAVAPTSRGIQDGSADPSRIYYTLPPVNVSDDPEWSTTPAMAADGLGNIHLVWHTDFRPFSYKT